MFSLRRNQKVEGLSLDYFDGFRLTTIVTNGNKCDVIIDSFNPTQHHKMIKYTQNNLLAVYWRIVWVYLTILWAWRSKRKGSISILRTLAFILLTVRKSQFCFQIRLLRTQLIGNCIQSAMKTEQNNLLNLFKLNMSMDIFENGIYWLWMLFCMQLNRVCHSQ